MANEVQTLSTDIHVITAEINAYQRVAGEAIFEIGFRLKGVRDNPQKYGFEGYRDWERWCDEELDMPRRSANRFIQAYEQMGSTSTRLSSGKIYEIISMPSEVDRQQFVEQPHTIPSTGETKTVDEMTVRELREVKKALKEAEQRESDARRSEEIAMRQLEQTEQQLAVATKPETVVIEKEVERVVEVDKTDYSAVERLKQYEERFGALENYSNRVRASNVDDVTTSIISFNMAVRDFIKRHAYLIKYQDTVEHIDRITQREYVEAVSALKNIAADFSKVTGVADYVDVEFSEVR